MISKMKQKGKGGKMEQNQLKWIAIARDVVEFLLRECILSAMKELSISENKS